MNPDFFRSVWKEILDLHVKIAEEFKTSCTKIKEQIVLPLKQKSTKTESRFQELFNYGQKTLNEMSKDSEDLKKIVVEKTKLEGTISKHSDEVQALSLKSKSLPSSILTKSIQKAKLLEAQFAKLREKEKQVVGTERVSKVILQDNLVMFLKVFY